MCDLLNTQTVLPLERSREDGRKNIVTRTIVKDVKLLDTLLLLRGFTDLVGKTRRCLTLVEPGLTDPELVPVR